MTDEQKIKTIIFEQLGSSLTHRESLFIIDVALREKTDSIYDGLSVEEREEILSRFYSSLLEPTKSDV